MYIDKKKVDRVDMIFITKKHIVSWFVSSRFLCLDILRNKKQALHFLHALLVSYWVVIVFMSLNESFETHSLCIQFWLTALSVNDVMVATFLKSIKS